MDKFHACEWQRSPEIEKGIIVGCDQQQEWLLEWWWERYSAENDFPVAFIDLGMSSHAIRWCAQRGKVISLDIDSSFVKPKEEISSDLACIWEGFYGPTLWAARPQWFKKPYICLNTPYQKSIWIDLDCEILRPIGDLFAPCPAHFQLALVREHATEHLPCLHPDVRYNGGVICFTHGSEIIRKWAQEAVVRNDIFWGGDPLLSSLIYELQLPVVELPDVYNWRLAQGLNVNALIYHWVGSAGKAYIKNYGGIKRGLQKLSCARGSIIRPSATM
jgi:hypothetical protein